jgi:hypothetical protein
MEAADKRGHFTRTDVEHKFREEFGRDLTPEEKRLLGWAEKAIKDSANNPPEPKRKTA